MGIWKACYIETISHYLDHSLRVLVDKAGHIHGILLSIYLQWLDPAAFSTWDV
jgi:hypothetical protein